MTHTVTATYSSKDQARNVRDELRASGIPAENIFIDEPANKIRVIVPKDTQPGIAKVLEKHGLDAVVH